MKKKIVVKIVMWIIEAGFLAGLAFDGWPLEGKRA